MMSRGGGWLEQVRAKRRWIIGGASLLAFGIALPVVAQRGPTSLLPPGFEDMESPGASEPANPAPAPPSPDTASPSPPVAAPSLSASDLGIADGSGLSTAETELPELTPEELAAQQARYDLPEQARRSLALIGPLTERSGGFGPRIFGTTSGRFLSALMSHARAPFVSRWGSILIRRALLSATDTPNDVNGADWAAERAWLLVRMGEADAARLMVQSVDTDRYTPRMQAVAMQAYLATGDMAGLCPVVPAAEPRSKTPGWKVVAAICDSYSGDQGSASGALSQARRKGVTGIDYRLGEKAVGAGLNARRSVKIEWEGVDTLTAWRFGLATAVNVPVPDKLMEQGGARVRAWQARAPMLPLATRLQGVDTAARLGVFSVDALVAFQAALAASDETLPQGFSRRADLLRTAYVGADGETRLRAMRDLWKEGNDNGYLGTLLTARAAAGIYPDDQGDEDVSRLIAAQLSAGYDIPAMRWGPRVSSLSDTNALGWALLAVGAPRAVVDISSISANRFVGDHGQRGKLFIAALAGLGRLPLSEAAGIAADQNISFIRNSRWSRAIDEAARRGEKGTVALLAGTGMQTGSWQHMPAGQLFHIISALRTVGLEPVARMIAAEAVMRS